MPPPSIQVTLNWAPAARVGAKIMVRNTKDAAPLLLPLPQHAVCGKDSHKTGNKNQDAV